MDQEDRCAKSDHTPRKTCARHQHQKQWLAVLDETEQQQLIVALHRLQERLQDSN